MKSTEHSYPNIKIIKLNIKYINKLNTLIFNGILNKYMIESFKKF